MTLPSHYPFPLHLSTAGHSKNRLYPLVKFQPVRVIKFLPAPTIDDLTVTTAFRGSGDLKE
jgi:hypothetical protein